MINENVAHCKAHHLVPYIEEFHGIRVLHICDAGSRLKGYALPNSDHDIKFIFTRDPIEYALVGNPQEQINFKKEVSGEILEVEGWDIRKTARLGMKSNAQVYEMLYANTFDWHVLLEYEYFRDFFQQNQCRAGLLAHYAGLLGVFEKNSVHRIKDVLAGIHSAAMIYHLLDNRIVSLDINYLLRNAVVTMSYFEALKEERRQGVEFFDLSEKPYARSFILQARDEARYFYQNNPRKVIDVGAVNDILRKTYREIYSKY